MFGKLFLQYLGTGELLIFGKCSSDILEPLGWLTEFGFDMPVPLS